MATPGLILISAGACRAYGRWTAKGDAGDGEGDDGGGGKEGR